MQEDQDREQDPRDLQESQTPTPGSAGAEPGFAGGAEADPGGAPQGDRRSRRYSAEERASFLRAYWQSGLTVARSIPRTTSPPTRCRC